MSIPPGECPLCGAPYGPDTDVCPACGLRLPGFGAQALTPRTLKELVAASVAVYVVTLLVALAVH